MILDSSAVVAIFMSERGADFLLAKIKSRGPVGIGAPTLLETAVVLARRSGGDPEPFLGGFLRECAIEVIPFGEEHYRVAKAAFLRFGKGRHPAALNFGDCLSYAAASVAGRPLLFVGDDFSKTDCQPA